MAMDAEITGMSMAHYDDVIELWQVTEGVCFDADDSPENIAAYLDRNPGLSFVARHAGSLVAAALCGHDGRRGYLHHLAVSQGHRGRGVGRALVDACMAALKGVGIPRCHAFVFADNDAGMGFWQSANWEQRGDLNLVSRNTADGSGECG